MLTRMNAVKRCLARVRRWKAPPNWSRRQWLEEVAAQAELAVAVACPAAGKPATVSVNANTLESHILNQVRTRHRQECSFCWHCGRRLVCEPAEELNDLDDAVGPMVLQLAGAVAQLAEPDRRLIKLLYWQHRTESEVAADFGVSQQAISKRKRRIIAQLADVLKKGEFDGGWL
ncbi:MAG: sigma factor-like helix-turn-helix DNA-binding protein [Phycisphaerae bacterium]